MSYLVPPERIYTVSDLYDADYFLRGRASGKSLYEDYRWLPELTIPMAERMIEHCGIRHGQKILDFGCARGYLVRAFRELGYETYGYDESKWALENLDPVAKPYVNWTVGEVPFWYNEKFDWIIAKDVLEHIEYVDLKIRQLQDYCNLGMMVIVPLSKFHGNGYVIEDYEKDVTHKQRLPLLSWVNFFLRHDWQVECAYRIPGIKDNYFKPGWEYGNGFITARRITDSGARRSTPAVG